MYRAKLTRGETKGGNYSYHLHFEDGTRKRLYRGKNYTMYIKDGVNRKIVYFNEHVFSQFSEIPMVQGKTDYGTECWEMEYEYRQTAGGASAPYEIIGRQSKSVTTPTTQKIRGGNKMLNLNKVYTHRSGANRDIRNAVKKGECEAGAYKTFTVDGGFQIQAVDIEQETAIVEPFAELVTPPQQHEIEERCEPTVDDNLPCNLGACDASEDINIQLIKSESKTHSTMSDMQALILNALISSKAIDSEWVVLSEVCDLPKTSLPGATRSLLAKGYIKTDWGKDKSGKKAAVATVTEGGIAALQAA